MAYKIFGQQSVGVTPGATFQKYSEYLNENYGAALQHIELAKCAINRETRYSRTSNIKVSVEPQKHLCTQSLLWMKNTKHMLFNEREILNASFPEYYI